MEKFVLGFIFNQELDKVVLIRKERPLWQSGFLNGVGGHVEHDETIQWAIKREVSEETGIECEFDEVGIMKGNDWHVSIFTAIVGNKVRPFKKTDEEPNWYYVKEILSDKEQIISNLKWLISYCIDFHKEKPLQKLKLEVNYVRK